MNLERWQDIRANVLDHFEVIDKYNEEDDDGHGTIEIIEFNGPLGKIKLEFCVRDVILDKQTKFSNRAGSGTSVEYIYSDKEKKYSLNVFKFVNDSWEEMDSSIF